VKAIEKRADVGAAVADWKRAFAANARSIGKMHGRDVLWHEHLGIWGVFGRTEGKGGIERDWILFGQKPHRFRSNMIVEINPAPTGIDPNVQGVFARDSRGRRWILRQGRMSVSGSRVKDDDFAAVTDLEPVNVEFSDGSQRAYYQVAQLDSPPAAIQESVAAFVAESARARLAKLVPSNVLDALANAQRWERGLKPEATGEYDFRARAAGKAERRHADVWQALAKELERRKIRHSNDRVAQYGPDLFTYDGPAVLFEIKVNASSRDVFEGVGQLHIYEQLLRSAPKTGAYRKVLVVPEGMRHVLEDPLASLSVYVVTYDRVGRSIRLDQKRLNAVLS
jgi:hypothetical protein